MAIAGDAGRTRIVVTRGSFVGRWTGESFFAPSVFLLAALVYETGDGDTPVFMMIPVLLVSFAPQFYVVGSLVAEDAGGG